MIGEKTVLVGRGECQLSLGDAGLQTESSTIWISSHSNLIVDYDPIQITTTRSYCWSQFQSNFDLLLIKLITFDLFLMFLSKLDQIDQLEDRNNQLKDWKIYAGPWWSSGLERRLSHNFVLELKVEGSNPGVIYFRVIEFICVRARSWINSRERVNLISIFGRARIRLPRRACVVMCGRAFIAYSSRMCIRYVSVYAWAGLAKLIQSKLVR